VFWYKNIDYGNKTLDEKVKVRFIYYHKKTFMVYHINVKNL